jgi:hypothetical protein
MLRNFPTHPSKIVDPNTGIYYSIIRDLATWDSASAACTANGGYVAAIANSRDNAFTSQLCLDVQAVMNGSTPGCWLGATRRFNISACSQPAAPDGATLKNTTACTSVITHMSNFLKPPFSPDPGYAYVYKYMLTHYRPVNILYKNMVN